MTLNGSGMLRRINNAPFLTILLIGFIMLRGSDGYGMESAGYLFGSWDRVVEQADFSPRDTATGIVFRGKMWISNGYPGNGLDWDRDLWSSDDGVSWIKVIDQTPYDAFSPMVVYNGKLWAIATSIWSSQNGVDWVREGFIPSTYVRGKVVVHDGKIWYLGDGPEVWSSIDGVNWFNATFVAPFGERTAPAVAAFDGKLWVMGGSTPAPGKGYSNPNGDGYPDLDMNNDVWSSIDGANWTRVIDHSPWKGRMWSVAQAYAGALWILAGYDNDAYANLSDAWYTTDGVQWQEFRSETSWPKRHETTAYVFDGSLWLVSGKNDLWGGPFLNDVWRVTATSSKCDGTLAAAVSLRAGSDPRSVAVHDFNGDGKVDLAVANGTSNDVSIFLGNGDGTFAAAVNYGAGSSPEGLAVGDFNGDGKFDLASANSTSDNVSILMGNVDGTFATAVNYGAGSSPRGVGVGDVNGDGRSDLAVANFSSDDVSILLGNAAVPLKVTEIASERVVPLMLTLCPPAVGPTLGLMLVILGAAMYV